MGAPASPYSNLEPRAFWRSAVTDREPLDPGDVYRPKFPITRDMRIATAGSCFAQHVGRALKTAGFNVIDTEPMPLDVDLTLAQRYGYELYSARYGNIYTTRQLMQLVEEARGKFTPAHRVWERDGRYVDAQRPSIEPDGFDSPEAVLAHRERHLINVRKAFFRCDLMVFTFGLTEAWIDRESGTVYPTAPGTIAGRHDDAVFGFHNYRYDEIKRDFETFMALMRARNKDVRFLITTSPVPLTATTSGHHVEVATCYSKSVLRAVCGALADANDDVDYFPSYEIITSANTRGVYYETNKRTVSRLGVQTAMNTFMAAHGAAPSADAAQSGGGADKTAPRRARTGGARADDVCEDALLEAFSR